MNENEININTQKLVEIKKKYEQIEIKLHKSEIENTKKNKEIQRLQNELQKFRKLTNDASTDYPWPEEFCERWKKLFESTIMDSFDNIFYKNILLVRVINIIVKIVYDFTKEKIIEKIKDILKCFGIEKNSEDYIKVFFKKFQTFIFQDYFKTIIKFDDILLKKILLNIRLEIGTQKGKLFSQIEIEEINKDLDSNQINFFIKELFILSLYMHFHDPHLSIKTSTELNYSYFSKKDFISLDGFGNDNSVCLIILYPPVLRFNTFFKKLVPIVFICENPTDEIIKECEIKRYYQLRKLQSKSFNVIERPLVFNLDNQINKDDNKNTINSDMKNDDRNINQLNNGIINNNNKINNGNCYISNIPSFISGNSNSNRNYLVNNKKNNEHIININEDNLNDYDKRKKKEIIRSKSSTKPIQNKNIMNQEELFKNKQINNKKQINFHTPNGSSISHKENNILNQKKAEIQIFNIINDKQLHNNDLKKEKSFTISSEINQGEMNIFKLKRENEKEKNDYSRNNSTFENEINNSSNNKKEENLEIYSNKLFTEMHGYYYIKNNTNFFNKPYQKKRTNSIDSQSEKCNFKNDCNSKNLNNQNFLNEKNIQNKNNNLLLRKVNFPHEQNNYNDKINNNNYNDIKNEKLNLYNMDISLNNNFENASNRSSTHNLIRNNSQVNENRIHNISINSIYSNNIIINNNISKQNNIIINNSNNDQNKKKDFLSNKNIYSKNGFENVYKGKHFKVDSDIHTNTLDFHSIENEENSTLNCNRIGHFSKNSYFSSNDIKSMKNFHKNENQKKQNKTLINKKKTDNQINFEIQQNRIKSPSLKNTINNNKNNNCVYNNNANHKEKQNHSSNQFNKYKKK